MKKTVCWLTILISFFLAISVTNVRASEKEDIKKELEGLKEVLVEKEVNVDNLEEEIDFQISEIDALETFKEKVKREIKELEEDTEKQNEIFKARIRAYYKYSSQSEILVFLNLLSNSKSLGDFFNRVEMFKYILKYDKEILTNQRNNKDMLKSKQDMLLRVEEETNSKVENLNVLLEEVDKEREKAAEELRLVEDKLAEILKKEYMEELRKKRLANLNSVYQIDKELLEQLTDSSGFVWPAPMYKRISSPFGYRIHPTLHYRKFHAGVDLASPMGTPVLAAIDGIVLVSDTMGGYGKAVVVSNGVMTTLYGHNSELLVNEGDYVSAGDVIARVGSTGRSTGPHVHFEVKVNGQLIDPLSLFLDLDKD